VVGFKAGGIGVRMDIFSLDITFFKSYGIRPALVNPPWMLFFVIKAKNAFLNA